MEGVFRWRGSSRVAVNNDGTLAYLHADHLGSASLATTPGGGIVTGSEIRYYPFGETRLGGAGLPTDRRYTGQREESDLGLYDYNARMYDPALGRFISADSIVPEPSNPQAFNRYSYVVNRPLKYNDPSGHYYCPPEAGSRCIEMKEPLERPYSINFEGDWPAAFRLAVMRGVRDVGNAMLKVLQAEHSRHPGTSSALSEAIAPQDTPLNAQGAFELVYGEVTFRRLDGDPITGWAETHLDWVGNGCDLGQICYDETMFLTANARNFYIQQNVAHELGHGIDHLGGRQARTNLASAWANELLLTRNANGFAQGGGWQQNRSAGEGEVFADMYIGWTYSQWAGSNTESFRAGVVKESYMRINMPTIIALAIQTD